MWTDLMRDGRLRPGAERTSLTLVRYPGIVDNVDRALQTLGGLSEIQLSLDLCYTPDNPFTRPMKSERQVQGTHNSGAFQLALRVRRKKSDPSVYRIQCIGMVDTLHTFPHLADYQYLPLRIANRPTPADGTTAEKDEVHEDLVPRIVPQSVTSALDWWQRPEDGSGTTPLFLPPFIFSRYTQPSPHLMQRDCDAGASKDAKAGHGLSYRAERKAYNIIVQATDEFPKSASPSAIAVADQRVKNPEPHRLLAELFQERPMWSRIGILYKTKLDDVLLKYILQKYAFYILSGPWGRLWCRYGYDPRTVPEGRIYQSVMVTFREHLIIPESKRLKLDTTNRNRPLVQDGGEPAPVDYIYRSGTLPSVRQMWYSLCDIQLLIAERMCDAPPRRLQADERHGYFEESQLEQVRNEIKEDVRAVSAQLLREEDEEDDIESVM